MRGKFSSVVEPLPPRRNYQEELGDLRTADHSAEMITSLVTEKLCRLWDEIRLSHPLSYDINTFAREACRGKYQNF